MELSYHRIFGSRPFRFLVGPEKQEFTIHSALVAYHSRPLCQLVNGPMAEAKSGSALLDDIDPSTFTLFCEYASSEKAKESADGVVDGRVDGENEEADIPAVEIDRAYEAEPIPAEPLAEPSAALDNYWGHFGSTHSKKYKKRGKYSPIPQHQPSKRKQLWNDFSDENRVVPTFNPNDCEVWNDYTVVFLSHARLYTFADRYELEPLAKLAVLKLRKTLAEIAELRPSHLANVTELLEYTYSNEHTLDRDGKELDRLRELVTHYTACVVEFFENAEEFQELLKRNGVFSRDLIRFMLRRLDTGESVEEEE